MKHNELKHYASAYYDPEYAHRYYEEHKKLKGRDPAKKEPETVSKPSKTNVQVTQKITKDTQEQPTYSSQYYNAQAAKDYVSSKGGTKYSTKGMSDAQKDGWAYAKDKINAEKKTVKELAASTKATNISELRDKANTTRQAITDSLREAITRLTTESSATRASISEQAALEKERISEQAALEKERISEQAALEKERISEQAALEKEEYSVDKIPKTASADQKARMREQYSDKRKSISAKAIADKKAVSDQARVDKKFVSDKATSDKKDISENANQQKSAVSEETKTKKDAERSSAKAQKEKIKNELSSAIANVKKTYIEKIASIDETYKTKMDTEYTNILNKVK